jgi:hypothetical protein
MTITAERTGPVLAKWAADTIEQGGAWVHHFTFKGHVINSTGFKAVADALRKSLIWLGYLPSGTQFDAGYVEGGYMLIERWKKSMDPVWYRSSLIHESVHAMLDIQGKGRPYHLHSHTDEAAAYIAQAMYLFRHGVLLGEVKTKGRHQECVQAAWHPAECLLKGTPMSRVAANNLSSVIARWYESKQRHKAGLK